MALARIALFSVENAESAIRDGASTSDSTTVAGVQVQDRKIIQVTSDTDDSPLLRTFAGKAPTQTYTLDLTRPAASDGGPATSPFMEVAVNYFPAARVTPDMQKQVEAEFGEFDRIATSVAEGNGEVAFGWSTEKVDHKGERTRPFFILRGWRSMQDFESLTKMDKVTKEGFPILFAWKVPFEMWHVERKT